ncbi:MAG: hypothetical protein DRI57_16585 [Deltaproteobacteria bacterium]|nr:MAG: hypothetical protein DRI57_16585 [Deltaproteobacteria bacterium]
MSGGRFIIRLLGSDWQIRTLNAITPGSDWQIRTLNAITPGSDWQIRTLKNKKFMINWLEFWPQNQDITR